MDKREYTRRVVAVMRHLTADEMTAIRAEIEGHIEDRMEPLLALQGVDQAEAEQRSIAAMGDPEEIGRELQKHYSYFWLWVDRILLALIVFVLLGSLCLAPVHLLHAWDGIVARVYPMAQAGEATPMYFPAMNEAAVDMTGASVTGLVRHYSKLLVLR